MPAEHDSLFWECPNCTQTLRMPFDAEGKTARCRNCGAEFVVAASSAISPSHDLPRTEDSLDSSRSAGAEPPSMVSGEDSQGVPVTSWQPPNWKPPVEKTPGQLAREYAAADGTQDGGLFVSGLRLIESGFWVGVLLLVVGAGLLAVVGPFRRISTYAIVACLLGLATMVRAAMKRFRSGTRRSTKP